MHTITLMYIEINYTIQMVKHGLFLRKGTIQRKRKVKDDMWRELGASWTGQKTSLFGVQKKKKSLKREQQYASIAKEGIRKIWVIFIFWQSEVLSIWGYQESVYTTWNQFILLPSGNLFEKYRTL